MQVSVRNNFVQWSSNFCVKIVTQIVTWVAICCDWVLVIIIKYSRYIVFLILYEGNEEQLLREICYPKSILSSNQDNILSSKLRCEPNYFGHCKCVFKYVNT